VFSPCDTILAHLRLTHSSTNGCGPPTTKKKLSDADNGSFTPAETSSIRRFFPFSSVNVASVVMSKKLRIGTGREKDTSLVPDCFRGVKALRPCWNKWIVSDVWADIVNAHCDLSDDLKFTSEEVSVQSHQNDIHSKPNGPLQILVQEAHHGRQTRLLAQMLFQRHQGLTRNGVMSCSVCRQERQKAEKKNKEARDMNPEQEKTRSDC
jgi:hypothetical protein